MNGYMIQSNLIAEGKGENSREGVEPVGAR